MLTCAACGGLTPTELPRTCLHCDAPLRRPPRWAVKLSALLGPTGALLLAACYGGAGRYHNPDPNAPNGATRRDNDGDGAKGPYECGSYRGDECRAELARRAPPPDLDCDDADRTRYPGAQDVDGDGIDQNCDGVDGWRDPSSVAVPPESPPAKIATPPGEPTPIAVPPKGTP